MTTRPTWNEYFFNVAALVATRSTCKRRHVGAVIVKDNQILATGYNGAPAHITHCQESGCIREELQVPSGEKHELCRGTHAEQNAIIQAAKHGVCIDGATLYCTHQPCFICTKMIINAGIKAVHYHHSYDDFQSLNMLWQAKIRTYTKE